MPQKLNYKLIITDFDGTLARSDGTVSTICKQEINRYVENGGKFAISTGRMPMGILSYARKIGLKGLVSCFQGAAIMDIETGKPVMEGSMSHELGLEICKKMEELGVHIHVYGLVDYYSNRINETELYYQRVVGRQCIYVENLTEYMRKNRICPYKLICLLQASESEKIYTELHRVFGERCYVTTSGANEYVFVEVCNKTYSKGTALAFLAKHYGIRLQETIAVGDQRNDIPMIETAGLGIAVNNAHPLLKEAASVTSPYTNEENAVAEIIKQYGYTEE